MLPHDAALDRIQVLVRTWMSNRRQSSGDVVGEIASILEATGREIDRPLPAPRRPEASLRLVADAAWRRTN